MADTTSRLLSSIAWLEERHAQYPTLRDPETGEGSGVSVGSPMPLELQSEAERQ